MPTTRPASCVRVGIPNPPPCDAVEHFCNPCRQAATDQPHPSGWGFQSTPSTLTRHLPPRSIASYGTAPMPPSRFATDATLLFCHSCRRTVPSPPPMSPGYSVTHAAGLFCNPCRRAVLPLMPPGCFITDTPALPPVWGREHPLHFGPGASFTLLRVKASPLKYWEAARRPRPFGVGDGARVASLRCPILHSNAMIVASILSAVKR